MQRRRVLGAVGFVAVLSMGQEVRAQNVANALQLGLGTDLVSYSKNTIEFDVAGDPETETSTTDWGLTGDSGVTLEVGYGVTETVVAGGFAQLGGTSEEVDAENDLGDNESSETTVLLGPKLDFMLSPGASVRPTLSAFAGFAHLSAETADETEISANGFVLGGRVALRCFVAPGFSLDPSVGANWLTLSGEAEPVIGDSVDLSGSGYGVSLGIGFSGWIP